MVPVTNTPLYELSVDSCKNRVYFNAKETLSNPDQVPDFIRDWEDALELVQPGFTLLADLSQVSYISQSLEALTMHVHRVMVEAGIHQAAEVYQKEDVEVHLSKIAQRTDFPLNFFDNVQDAERWLDEL
ncbi:hypothetical protein GU926_06105 [Nibribacter ruber]|uniref:STAS/SEC14 domain-containing protein n=1 Tax=Nibribacter ruber TaxID=2698458 RepID=A0A6P1NVF2_9BACT|nr:hypothetical protein [Nibribacter ruber]QHL87030.1 hypothetical protein GU926_06105 [Nibribacter ruber]